jgi:uncharacterized protein
MKFESQRELPCSQATAWAALNDDAMLQQCIPGCESLQRTAPEQLQAVVMAAVGPVRARFTGVLTLLDVQAPHQYRLQFEGKGGVAGFGKGAALVRLSPLPAGRCLLAYNAEAQVGGKLAQLGSRVVEAASAKLVDEFFARFEAAVAAAPAGSAEMPAQPEPEGNASWALRLQRWCTRCWAALRGGPKGKAP